MPHSITLSEQIRARWGRNYTQLREAILRERMEIHDGILISDFVINIKIFRANEYGWQKFELRLKRGNRLYTGWAKKAGHGFIFQGSPPKPPTIPATMPKLHRGGYM